MINVTGKKWFLFWCRTVSAALSLASIRVGNQNQANVTSLEEEEMNVSEYFPWHPLTLLSCILERDTGQIPTQALSHPVLQVLLPSLLRLSGY